MRWQRRRGPSEGHVHVLTHDAIVRRWQGHRTQIRHVVFFFFFLLLLLFLLFVVGHA